MYYDLEKDFSDPKPDIDEKLENLKNCRVLAEKEYESSEKTKEDFEKYNGKLLAIAETKNRLLEEKLSKKEAEASGLLTSYYELLEKTRFMFAEKLFLCLLCGLAATVFFPAADFLSFVFQIVGSFLVAFVAALLTSIFPKRKNFLGSFYDNHPFAYAVICFIILFAIVNAVKFFL